MSVASFALQYAATNPLQTAINPAAAAPQCPPQTTNETFYFPNPYNCSTYYQCSNGAAIEQLCPPGLHFSLVTSTCVFPLDANCTEVPQKDLYPAPCPESNIILPVPFDCSSYMFCLEDAYALVMPCPPGLLFNPDILVCDYPEHVECGTRSSTENPITVTAMWP